MRKSHLWAGAITLAIGAWMGSVYLLPPAAETHAEPVPAEETAAAPFKVKVKTFTASFRETNVTARGITAESERVQVRARTWGTIIISPTQQGQRVKTGDLLCELDTAGRNAKLLEARTALESAERDYKASARLGKKNYTSESKVLSDKARVDQAKAELERLQWDLSYTSIAATADGMLAEKPAEAGSLLEPGGVCATISVFKPMLVVVQVPERAIPYIREGMSAKATLATGQTVEGTVRFIALASDLATRTFKVELAVPNETGDLRAGVTSEMQVPLPPVSAHKLPASVLGLDDQGRFGVRLVKPDNTVEFAPVMLIAQEKDGTWVAGLPPSATVITVGQDYVRDGEKVDPVVETAEAQS